MMTCVFIAPHERLEAVQVYGDQLTYEQIEKIEEAPEDAWIKLIWEISGEDAKPPVTLTFMSST